MHTSVNNNGAYFARAFAQANVHHLLMPERRIDTAWFKAEMKRMGVTQEDIAARAGRDRTIISKIINGKLDMDVDHAHAFAEVLGVPTQEILRRAGRPIEPTTPALDRKRLARALTLVDRIVTQSNVQIDLDGKLEIVETVYLASEDIPDVELERDILLHLLHYKAAKAPGAS